MAASPSRVCWDSCSWIALIQREQIKDSSGNIVENRYALARSVLDRAEKGAVEIVISGLCLVEVNKPSSSISREQLVAYFDNDYILLAPVDRLVATKARSLMFAAHPGLKPPDAIHLATALISSVEELHTFDERLLDLNGQLVKADGTLLRICKPAFGGEPLPLLEMAMVPSAEPTPVSTPNSERAISEVEKHQLQITPEGADETVPVAPREEAGSDRESENAAPEELPEKC